MKRFAQRIWVALPISLMASAGFAQSYYPGVYGSSAPAAPIFTAMSNGEMEQKRTAELLADTQRPTVARSGPYYTSSNQPAATLDVSTLTARSGPVQALPFTPSPDQYQSYPVYKSAEEASAMQRSVPVYVQTAYAQQPAYSVATAAPQPAAPVYTYTPPAPVVAAPVPKSSNKSSSIGTPPQTIPAMPDAHAGECFALVRVPEQFRSVVQQFESRAASERVQTIPARYEDVVEQYVVQPSFERIEVIPAVFRMVTEEVQVSAPSSRYVSTEPVYETVSEQVLESPARSVWKRGNGPITRVDNTTGDIMCLVEEPATYKTITRRVLKAPASVQEVPIPGQNALVTKRVLEKPEEVRRIVVPEQLGTRTVRRLAEPAQIQRIGIPAEVGTTTVRELVAPSRLEWRSVLCQTNMTPSTIGRVQQALMREGFNPGAANGSLTPQTITALNAYQRARNLPEDQYMNMDTIHALGVM